MWAISRRSGMFSIPVFFSHLYFFPLDQVFQLECLSTKGSQCSMSVFLRKLYWTDGDTINIANTDGSNRSVLFTNQKGPVGQWPEQSSCLDEHIPVAVGCCINPLGVSFSRPFHWLWHGAAVLDQLRQQHDQPLPPGRLWPGGARWSQGKTDQSYGPGNHGWALK